MKSLLVVLAVALCAVAVGVPAAQTAPTSATGCMVEHLSGAECQGPDFDAAANACEITTWVDNASCTLTVPDGVASAASGAVGVFAELQGTSTWHAELDLVIRDQNTGQVLYSRNRSTTRPVTPGDNVPEARLMFNDPLSSQGGATVICEATGTHTPAGAPFSAAAALEGAGAFNNTFACSVN